MINGIDWLPPWCFHLFNSSCNRDAHTHSYLEIFYMTSALDALIVTILLSFCSGDRCGIILDLAYINNPSPFLFSPSFSISFPSSGHGSYQHALSAPHGGLWRFLHRSSHPAANLRCLLEVREQR